MIFCGQCGLQLGPNDVRCPRCGAKVDVGNGAVEALHTDDATIASPLPTMSYADGQVPPAYTPPQPQQPQPKLVLRSNTPYDQQGYEVTSRVESPDYQGTMNVSYPSQPGYPARGASYPGFGTQQDYPVGSGGAGQFEQRRAAATAAAASQRAKGRTASLVIILLGLLLVLGAMVLFALQHNGVINLFGGTASNPTAGPTASATATLTPSEQGQAVVRQLYKNVNDKNYQAAYDLWLPNAEKQTFASFKSGYAHTRHTNLTIIDTQVQSDGTVKVSVSLVATEDANGGKTKQSAYQGYYVVQQQANGTWLIQRGMLEKV